MEQSLDFYNCFKIKNVLKVITKRFPEADETTRITDSKSKESRSSLLSSFFLFCFLWVFSCGILLLTLKLPQLGWSEVTVAIREMREMFLH